MTELQISCSSAEWTAAASADKGLIERAKRDPKAFAVLYRQHYDAIAGHVFRRTGDTHATEDIVAEVFLAAMHAIGRFRYRGVPFRAWLFRIATNKVNQWARRERRRAVVAIDTESVAETVPATPKTNRVSDGEQARRALLTLSPKYQSVLALHYLEEMSVAEIATVIGCRVGTIKSRLSRGRDALRERLTLGR